MSNIFTYCPQFYTPGAVHVSLDLETASLETNAAIVQLGAAALTHKTIPTYSQYISLASNEKARRDVSKGTMEWWDKEDPALRKRVFAGTTELEFAVNQFIEWCNYLTNDNLERVILWSKPQCFDIPILKSAIEQFREYPFGHRNVGCVYTLLRTVPPEEQERRHNTCLRVYQNLESHNALHDAMYQREMIRASL